MRGCIKFKKVLNLGFLFFVVLLIANATAVATAQQVQANIPSIIPHQGVLRYEGKSVTGNYNFKFEIFDSPTAGAKLWEEEQKGIPVSRGKYQVYLGKVSPLTESLAKDNLLYIQVYVKTVDEPAYKSLSPRLQLNPTFAKVPKSGTSDVANSVNVSKIVGKITDAMIEAVSASKIAGLLSVDNIPPLNADKITGGVFNALRIPSLDKLSGKINDSQISDVGAGKISGQISDFQISGVAAGKVSGVLSSSSIPNLDVGKITTGVFSINQIPSIGDSKITDVGAGKITTGTFAWDRMPAKMAAGTASVTDGATINFNTKSFGVSSFSTTPNVVCSSEDGYICAATSVSTTGFTVKLKEDNGQRPASPKSVNWQAIGS